MRKLRQISRACALLPAVGLASAPDAEACSDPVRYRTVISAADLHNSSGVQLTTVGAIVRQDRANYHKFGRRDLGDEGDSMLFDEQRRADLERAVNRPLDMFDESMLMEHFIHVGTVAVTFWHCENPPRAVVEPLFDDPTQHETTIPQVDDEDFESGLDLLPPPPE